MFETARKHRDNRVDGLVHSCGFCRRAGVGVSILVNNWLFTALTPPAWILTGAFTPDMSLSPFPPMLYCTPNMSTTFWSSRGPPLLPICT